MLVEIFGLYRDIKILIKGQIKVSKMLLSTSGKCFLTQNKQLKKLLGTKFYLKLGPSVNFINVLRAAFAPVDPKSVKRYWQLDRILMLLGATGVKFVHKYVGEIVP